MAQIARPVSTFTFVDWDSHTGFPDSYQDVDEATPNDSDFAWSLNGATGGSFEVVCSTLIDPEVGTGHIIRFRAAKVNDGVLDNSGKAITPIITIWQDINTQIAVEPMATPVSDVFTDYSYTLTEAQANAITDYSGLHVAFNFSESGGGGPSNSRGLAVSWVEIEIPDATGGPPTLLSATMLDVDRNYETFEQDITLNFSAAVEIVPAPNVGDIIAGLTADVDFGGIEEPLRYVSGNGTTIWKVRLTPSLEIFSADSSIVMIDYVPATGDMVSVEDATELTGFTDTIVTSNLSTVIWERIRNKDNINLNAVEVQYALFQGGLYDIDNANWMIIEQKGTLVTSADGVFNLPYTGASTPGTLGGDKYLGILHPNSGPTESMIWKVRIR